MSIPAQISGLGGAQLVPLRNGEFDPVRSGCSAEDYFVLTRVDGRTSLKDIVLISGFPVDKAIAILKKLYDEGAIVLPGGAVPRASAPSARVISTDAPSARSSATTDTVGTAADPVPPEWAPFLAEEVDLDDAQKLAVLRAHDRVRSGHYFELLGVSADADGRAVKRAYFALSKEFHPDRFYGKSLGTFRERLVEIFRTATEAFDTLRDETKREAYQARLRGGARVGAQTSTEHAAALFARACILQAQKEWDEALKFFAAACRADAAGSTPKRVDYWVRAASCALEAERLSEAAKYAKHATEIESTSASAHRTLAKVYRLMGQPEQAREELEVAFRLDPQNDRIAAELDECK